MMPENGKVLDLGIPVGWAVLLDTQMKEHKQFGSMRVGTIVDCLSLPGDEAKLISLCRVHLKSRGVDLIISNQSHSSWCEALVSSSFLKGPSNYIFATSPKLTQALGNLEAGIGAVHMNRGDGDGPIHI